MKLSVVIVSYNVKFYLVQCLRSLQKALKNIDSEIIIVDNSSSDGSVEYFSMHYPDVKIISSSLNLGFAKANNVAINQSSGEYVLLLNPDTIVGETTIQDVISFMDIHKKILIKQTHTANSFMAQHTECTANDFDTSRTIPWNATHIIMSKTFTTRKMCTKTRHLIERSYR